MRQATSLLATYFVYPYYLLKAIFTHLHNTEGTDVADSKKRMRSISGAPGKRVLNNYTMNEKIRDLYESMKRESGESPIPRDSSLMWLVEENTKN